MARERKWEGTTHGSSRMHTMLIGILRVVDVRLIYLFTAIFIIPITLIVRPSRGVICRYFRYRFGYSRLRALWKTYVNHCLFSQLVIDRFAMYAGRRFNVSAHGVEHFKCLEEGHRGFVMLSSHVGNYEIAGYTLTSTNKSINALVYGGEKESVMNHRAKMFGRTHINMIPTQDDMSHLFAINTALSDNQVVSIPADRIIGSEKSIELDFLGAKARFPQGPFAVPAMRGADVIAVNVVKTSLLAYTILLEPIPYDKSLPRKEQLQQLACNYAGVLEKVVRRYPEQWYNFFDFWA